MSYKSFLTAVWMLVSATSAPASVVIYSNLSSTVPLYNPNGGPGVLGSPTTSFTRAMDFNSGVGGSVSQVDLAVTYLSGLNTVDASIWTDAGGVPDSIVTNASWSNLVVSEPLGGCCGLVTVSGISGVQLASATDYFMVVGPSSLTGPSDVAWNINNQSLSGLTTISRDGGLTWEPGGVGTLSAFDVIGSTAAPEPSTLAVCGLILGVAIRRVFIRPSVIRMLE
jgi:hypothetical protein